MDDVARLLAAARDDPGAADRLLPLVYAELRRLARPDRPRRGPGRPGPPRRRGGRAGEAALLRGADPPGGGGGPRRPPPGRRPPLGAGPRLAVPTPDGRVAPPPGGPRRQFVN